MHTWGFSMQEYWSGLPCPLPGNLPNPGIEPRSTTKQADSLLSEPPGKAKSTRVGSLSLIQGIFLTQELNWGLLHCRWILYQLSYQGSPFSVIPIIKKNIYIYIYVYIYGIRMIKSGSGYNQRSLHKTGKASFRF